MVIQFFFRLWVFLKKDRFLQHYLKRKSIFFLKSTFLIQSIKIIHKKKFNQPNWKTFYIASGMFIKQTSQAFTSLSIVWTFRWMLTSKFSNFFWFCSELLWMTIWMPSFVPLLTHSLQNWVSEFKTDFNRLFSMLSIDRRPIKFLLSAFTPFINSASSLAVYFEKGYSIVISFQKKIQHT